MAGKNGSFVYGKERLNDKGEYVWWESLLVLILCWYPLRHIYQGVDLWDTGYNYANFLYMGVEHMDPMWLFSTYLANAVGHLLTKLPAAGGLAGMNLYTGLFVSALAVMGYLFCTRKLKIPYFIAFLGEFMAISLCWCPTALLYNYLTYVLFLGCVISLYKGLTEEKRWHLFAAGICLGSNVLVRFSNLPEAAMIVAVWAWDVIVALEAAKVRNAGRYRSAGREKESRIDKRAEKDKKVGTDRGAGGSGKALTCMKNMLRHTGWCLGGYLAALAALLGYIHIRYGMGNYVAGISRLFAMTENATDYKATSMLMGMVGIYVENLYWAVRIGVIVIVGMIGFALQDFAAAAIFPRDIHGIRDFHGKRRTGEKDGIQKQEQGHGRKLTRVGGMLEPARLLWCAVTVLMIVWLYYRGFCSFEYYSYGAILRPGVLFLMLTMLIGLVRIFHPESPKEEKLVSGMVILVILLTSIGSNNGIYPSLNNLFLAGPYTLWQCWRFVGVVKDRYVSKGRVVLRVSAFPAKTVMVALLLLAFVQSALFGASFVFVEATGARNITGVIGNNRVLQGVKMSPERAEWLGDLSAYVNENGLLGREVILFGQIPALSYYLQMPSAFNPWSDLRSYSYEAMLADMERLSFDVETGVRPCPVIILERQYAREYEIFLTGGAEALRQKGVEEKRIEWIGITERKYRLLKEFTEKYNYDLTYENEKFVVYEAGNGV